MRLVTQYVIILSLFGSLNAQAVRQCNVLYQQSENKSILGTVKSRMQNFKSLFGGGSKKSSNIKVQVEIPPLEISEAIKVSGNYNYDISVLRLRDLNTLIRNEIAFARFQKRPLHIAEISAGIPLTATALLNANSFRQRGDMLISVPQNTPFDPITPMNGGHVQLPNAYPVKAFVFAPKEPTQDLLMNNNSAGRWFTEQLFENFRDYVTDSRRYYGRFDQPDTGSAVLNAIHSSVQKGIVQWKSGRLIDELAAFSAKGNKLDILIAHEFAREPNRLKALELIQNLLAPMGRALIPLSWWKSTSDHRASVFSTFADTVQTRSGQNLPLETYLSQTYPQSFEVKNLDGISFLVVKGTPDPVILGRFLGLPTDNVNSLGLPEIQWIEGHKDVE